MITSSVIPNNLPLALSSFIGRARETAELKQLLVSTRLLTLTGVGGSGKTRLALGAATNVADAFDEGVWWVELAPISDPALVPQAAANAMGQIEQPNRQPVEVVGNFLRDKSCLLILDNCEHLLEACAHLVEALLIQCPNLHILVTSREALNVAGEYVWIVPSLQFPTGRWNTSESLADYDAIRLFVERARAARTDFTLTDQNAPVVIKICQRLDGIPLAIELAAARIRFLSPEQILGRLDDALLLLSQGKRTAPQRHQTLRATLDWSHDLLSEPEKILFRRLSVFAGGFTLEAAEAVCTGDGLDQNEGLGLLASLVNKSLLVLNEQTDRFRYRFLEPIRQYAHAKLVEADEAVLTQDHHLAYFHDWVKTAAVKLQTAQQLLQLTSLELEFENIRKALQWALDTRPVLALEIVASMTHFWNVRGYSSEGRRWGERALKCTEADYLPETRRARGQALRAVAFLTMTQGDNLLASSLIAEAIALLREQNDRRGLGWALFVQSSALSYLGQFSMSLVALEESLAIGYELDDPSILSGALGLMAGVKFRQGEIEEGKYLMEQGLASSRRLSSPSALAGSLLGASLAAVGHGDLKAARRYSEESLALVKQIGDKHRINTLSSQLANILRVTGELPKATALYLEAIHGWRDYGQIGGIARCIECLAFIALAEKRDTQAARWFGAAEALREGSQARMIPNEQEEYEREMTILRGRLSGAVLEQAWTAGRALTLEQAMAELELEAPTLETIPDLRQTAHVPHDLNSLTAREADVLRLLAKGLSDTQIAEQLVVSRRTVTTHLTTIYGKFGVKSRSAAIRYALDHQLV